MLRFFASASLLLWVCQLAMAQNNGEILGKLSGDNGEPLPLATVTVYRAADTVLLDYVLSEDDGSFRLRRLPIGTTLRLIAPDPRKGPIEDDVALTPDRPARAFGLIPMTRTPPTLDDILVQAERPPVVMHH